MRTTRNLLCVVPPYFSAGAPPLGPASLLGYLRAHGHDDVDFLDLRLWVPNSYAPTYRPVGVFGETYIMDVPDLPLVLGVLRNAARGHDPLPESDDRYTRYCLERGISVTVLADYLAGMNRFLDAALRELPQLRFVGFSVWASNYLTTLIAAAHLKRRKNPPFIILGGPQTTESVASAQLALRSGLANLVALGEGEDTLLRTYEAVTEHGGAPPDLIPGTLRYNAGTRSFESAGRALLRLPTLPLPAFDKLPVAAYQRGHGPHRTLTFELSRGCTDKCVFCSEWVFWKRIRNDAISHAVDNVVELQRRYDCDAIWFMDSLLNATLNRLHQFAEELLRRDIRLRWGGYLRANVDRDTARLLKRAGCEFVFVGVESLSDETLDQMNKRRTKEDNLGALDALLGAGIDRVVAGLIPGFPSDTRNRFLRTALTLGKVHQRYPSRFRVNVEPFVISPSQPMYARMGDYGLVPRPWDEQYLDIAAEYRDITGQILCSVDGPNQGIDRLGEYHIAETVTATTAVTPDPFQYYEGEVVSSAELQLREILDGWYLGLMKTDSALAYGLVLSRAERMEYERLVRDETVGYGIGYGRRPQSSLFGRDPFAGFLTAAEARHLVPPRRDAPILHRGSSHRGVPAPTTKVALSPFVVVRTADGAKDSVSLVADVSAARWHALDGRWEGLLRLLATRPRTMAELIERGPADTPAELVRLLDLGLLWATGKPGEVVAAVDSGANHARAE